MDYKNSLFRNLTAPEQSNYKCLTVTVDCNILFITYYFYQATLIFWFIPKMPTIRYYGPRITPFFSKKFKIQNSDFVSIQQVPTNPTRSRNVSIKGYHLCFLVFYIDFINHVVHLYFQFNFVIGRLATSTLVAIKKKQNRIKLCKFYKNRTFFHTL